jgi:tetrahydromethanopterin:alpha-L-glutamate ligase
MRYGILVSDPDDWTARSLFASLVESGAEATFINFSSLSSRVGDGLRLSSRGIDLSSLDGIIVRDLGRSGSQDVAFRFEALRALEELGVPITNSTDSIARAANKFATSLALQREEVPTPRTMATTSLDDALSFVDELGKAVFKPLFGFKGRGIELITRENSGSLAEIIDRQGVLYLQEVVELGVPRDIRAFVVGDRLAGAIYRVAPPGSWISNLAKGGSPEVCTDDEEVRELALRAGRCVGTAYCGVDLLETPEGLKVIEVNGTPSGRGIFLALGVDVGKMIAEMVI